MRTIEVIVFPTGEARIETHGFQGPACQQADEFLRRSLGRIGSEQLLSAYHQIPATAPCVPEQRRVGRES